MESLSSYQNLRIVTVEGMIADGDYILEKIIVRIRKGYLCDSVDENKNILPAVESHDGNHIEHWLDGELHQIEAPAIIDILNNSEEWWLFGKQIFPESLKTDCNNDKKGT